MNNAIAEESAPVASTEEILRELEAAMARLDYVLSSHIQQAHHLGEELRGLALIVSTLKEVVQSPAPLIVNIDKAAEAVF